MYTDECTDCASARSWAVVPGAVEHIHGLPDDPPRIPPEARDVLIRVEQCEGVSVGRLGTFGLLGSLVAHQFIADIAELRAYRGWVINRRILVHRRACVRVRSHTLTYLP